MRIILTLKSVQSMNCIAMSVGRLLFGLFLGLALTGCGQESAPVDTDAKPDVQTAAAPAAHSSTASEQLDNAREPNAARVYIVSPSDGDVVSSPVRVVFGIEGMTLAPAGSDTPNSGHHHLLIDVNELPPMDLPIPADDQHVHFGKAQTEAEIELTPGQHTLQLLLGDRNHMPHDPPVMSPRITITVE